MHLIVKHIKQRNTRRMVAQAVYLASAIISFQILADLRR